MYLGIALLLYSTLLLYRSDLRYIYIYQYIKLFLYLLIRWLAYLTPYRTRRGSNDDNLHRRFLQSSGIAWNMLETPSPPYPIKRLIYPLSLTSYKKWHSPRCCMQDSKHRGLELPSQVLISHKETDSIIGGNETLSVPCASYIYITTAMYFNDEYMHPSTKVYGLCLFYGALFSFYSHRSYFYIYISLVSGKL